MCNDWRKEFKGWCKSFTRTEIVLAILESLLLIVCIGFLIFLILHILVCFYKHQDINSTNYSWTTEATVKHNDKVTGREPEKYVYIHQGDAYSAVVTISSGTGTEKFIFINKGVSSKIEVTIPYNLTPKRKSTVGKGETHKKIYINKDKTSRTHVTRPSDEDVRKKTISEITSIHTNGQINQTTKSVSTEVTDSTDTVVKEEEQISEGATSESTLNAEPTTGENVKEFPTHTTTDIECSWHPSRQTEAPTRYYATAQNLLSRRKTIGRVDADDDDGVAGGPPDLEALAYDDNSDGEEAPKQYEGFVLALVRARPGPGGEAQLGCAVTAVAAQWALTAASCLDAIEEADSLDAFVVREGFGAPAPGRAYAVADVRVHPLYRGANRTHDLAALRLDRRLGRRAEPARLPTLLDYYALTAAERLTVVGFGGFRNMAQRPGERGLRAVHVYTLPSRQCAPAEGEGAWALRHLGRGHAADGAEAPAQEAARGGGPICAGVLFARGAPCLYCAGTPLLRAATLLGVMTDARQCAVACEPSLYVNVAALRDWIYSVLDVD